MDKNPQGEEVSLDQARELLIAISQSLPDNLLNCKSEDDCSNGSHGATLVTDGDAAEELRSELISISYVPSPDKMTLPTMGIQG